MHTPPQRGQCGFDFNQMEDDRLVRPEHRAGGDAKQKGITNLAGGAGDCDSNGCLAHSEMGRDYRCRLQSGASAEPHPPVLVVVLVLEFSLQLRGRGRFILQFVFSSVTSNRSNSLPSNITPKPASTATTTAAASEAGRMAATGPTVKFSRKKTPAKAAAAGRSARAKTSNWPSAKTSRWPVASMPRGLSLPV